MIVYIVLMAYLLLIASFVLKNHVRVITFGDSENHGRFGTTLPAVC